MQSAYSTEPGQKEGVELVLQFHCFPRKLRRFYSDGLCRFLTSSGVVRGMSGGTAVSVRPVLPRVQRGSPSNCVQRLEETASAASALSGTVRALLAHGLGPARTRSDHYATTDTNLSPYPAPKTVSKQYGGVTVTKL